MAFQPFPRPLGLCLPPLSSATNGQDAYFLNVLYELSLSDVALYLSTVEQLLNVAIPVNAATQTIEAWLAILGSTKRDANKLAKLNTALRMHLCT